LHIYEYWLENQNYKKTYEKHMKIVIHVLFTLGQTKNAQYMQVEVREITPKHTQNELTLGPKYSQRYRYSVSIATVDYPQKNEQIQNPLINTFMYLHKFL